jgi:hypothetical protein
VYGGERLHAPPDVLTLHTEGLATSTSPHKKRDVDIKFKIFKFHEYALMLPFFNSH